MRTTNALNFFGTERTKSSIGPSLLTIMGGKLMRASSAEPRSCSGTQPECGDRIKPRCLVAPGVEASTNRSRLFWLLNWAP
jgi:hypothetical protein